jgi:hypothetical protein
MIIGAPQIMCSFYGVSRDDRPVRSSLKRRVEVIDFGEYYVSLQFQFSADATVRHFTTTHPAS